MPAVARPGLAPVHPRVAASGRQAIQPLLGQRSAASDAAETYRIVQIGTGRSRRAKLPPSNAFRPPRRRSGG